MANADQAQGIVSDVMSHLAGIFRHMLPGVLVVSGAYIAYPDWFRSLRLDSTEHLIVLGVIAITTGNTWFALNRYGLHQLVDVVLYLVRSNGPAMGARFNYIEDLGRYTYKSLHTTDASTRAREHVRFRASTVLLILTLGELAMIFSVFHADNSIIENKAFWTFLAGVATFSVGVLQMIITRRIDYFVVYPPTDAAQPDAPLAEPGRTSA